MMNKPSIFPNAHNHGQNEEVTMDRRTRRRRQFTWQSHSQHREVEKEEEWRRRKRRQFAWQSGFRHSEEEEEKEDKIAWQSSSQHKEEDDEEEDNSLDNPTLSIEEKEKKKKQKKTSIHSTTPLAAQSPAVDFFSFTPCSLPVRNGQGRFLPQPKRTTIATTADQSAAGQSITSAVLTTTAGQPSYCRRTRSPLPLVDGEHSLLPLLRHVHGDQRTATSPFTGIRSSDYRQGGQPAGLSPPHPPPPTTLFKIKGPPSPLQTRFVSRLGLAARLISRTSVRFRFGPLLSSKKKKKKNCGLWTTVLWLSLHS